MTPVDWPALSAYTIGPAGLAFIFNLYAMGSFAQGTLVSVAPYGVLWPLETPDSPLRRFEE